MLFTICSNDKAQQKKMVQTIHNLAEADRVSLTLLGFNTVEELTNALTSGKAAIDVVVLDIDEPDHSGVHVAQDLRNAGYEGVLVLVSRSDEYAIPAFDVGAFNYALKGDEDDDARFERIIEKAIGVVSASKKKTLMLNGITEHRKASLDDITYFSIYQHICVAHFNGGEEFQFVSTLDKVEAKLVAYGFIRTHRTYIVNLGYVKDATYKKAIMKNGEVVPVGRSRWDDFKEAFETAQGNQTHEPLSIKQDDARVHQESRK